jgi:hypothetical protein
MVVSSARKLRRLEIVKRNIKEVDTKLTAAELDAKRKYDVYGDYRFKESLPKLVENLFANMRNSPETVFQRFPRKFVMRVLSSSPNMVFALRERLPEFLKTLTRNEIRDLFFLNGNLNPKNLTDREFDLFIEGISDKLNVMLDPLIPTFVLNLGAEQVKRLGFQIRDLSKFSAEMSSQFYYHLGPKLIHFFDSMNSQRKAQFILGQLKRQELGMVSIFGDPELATEYCKSLVDMFVANSQNKTDYYSYLQIFNAKKMFELANDLRAHKIPESQINVILGLS